MSSSQPLTIILNGEEDLDTVYGKVFPARTLWNNIGLGLKINPDTLGAINVDCPGDCDKALRKMLGVWFDTKNPTWEKLCKCLCKNTVSRKVLADEIQDYVIKQGTIFTENHDAVDLALTSAGAQKASAKPTRSSQKRKSAPPKTEETTRRSGLKRRRESAKPTRISQRRKSPPPKTEETTQRSGLKRRRESEPIASSSKRARVIKPGKIEDDVVLMKIGDELADKWIKVGVELGMKYMDLKRTIEKDPTTQHHIKPMEMLQKWRSTAGDSFTYENLALALERVGLVTCAQTYCYEQ